MSPSGHYNAINQMARGGSALNSAGRYFDNLAQKHPNTAATIKAAGSVIDAFGTGKGKTQATSGSKLCSFHGDTLVPTTNGYKPINKITTRDWVLSKNEATGQIDYQPVLNHYNSRYNQSVYITIADNTGNTQTIISNTIHPFFIKAQDGSTPPVSSEGHHYQGDIKDGYWVDASNLKSGYQLLSENNTWQTVQQVLLTNEPLSAYNLSVNHNHTYFVAGKPNGKYQAFGVWVHNDCRYFANTKAATDAAKSLGYSKTKQYPFDSHGQPVYKKGNRYITPDVDGHNGGVWKVFDNKGRRLGTADANLNIFKR